jgi:hypothetical protein
VKAIAKGMYIHKGRFLQILELQKAPFLCGLFSKGCRIFKNLTLLSNNDYIAHFITCGAPQAGQTDVLSYRKIIIRREFRLPFTTGT